MANGVWIGLAAGVVLGMAGTRAALSANRAERERMTVRQRIDKWRQRERRGLLRPPGSAAVVAGVAVTIDPEFEVVDVPVRAPERMAPAQEFREWAPSAKEVASARMAIFAEQQRAAAARASTMDAPPVVASEKSWYEEISDTASSWWESL